MKNVERPVRWTMNSKTWVAVVRSRGKGLKNCKTAKLQRKIVIKKKYTQKKNFKKESYINCISQGHTIITTE